MSRILENWMDDEWLLGELAMQFRGTRDEQKRAQVVQEYSRTVDRLIQRGSWTEMPPPEDQLPMDCMPKAFVDFWLSQCSEVKASAS